MSTSRTLVVEGFDDDEDEAYYEAIQEAFRKADHRKCEAQLCYEASLVFHKRGFNVVPQKAADKKHPGVYWTELQARRVTLAELMKWRSRSMFADGVGFITGAISGVIVIESDGPAGDAVLAEFEKTHGDLPETFIVRSGSGRGLHRYFRHPGFHVTTRANTSIKLDVKGDRGFCVLPPSLHKSGGRYEVVSGVKPAHLPEGLLDFIEAEAAKAGGRSATPGQTIGEPSYDDLSLDENTNLFKRLPVNPANIVIIMSMLDALPDRFASEHDDWLKVGFALHDFDNGAVGLALWKKFSQRCPAKVDEVKCEARWASFDNGYSGKKRKLGSLVHHAKESGGWGAPRQWDWSPDLHERDLEK